MREVVLNDLTNLQLAPSPELFHHAAALMMEKWESAWPGSELSAYFRETVLAENSTF